TAPRTRRGEFEQAGPRGSAALGSAAMRIPATDTRIEIRNGSNPKLRQRKRNSQQERTSKFVQRSYVCRRYVSCPVKKMAFVIVFWTTYIPFVILMLSLAGRHAMRALRGPRFERLAGGDGAPMLSTRRPASAYVSSRLLSPGRLRA